MDDSKKINTITLNNIQNLDGEKLFHSSSSKNFCRKNNLYYLKLEQKSHKKCFKSKIKFINNKKQQFFINNKNNYNLNEYKKINIAVNKRISKNKFKCKININNAPIPVHNVKNNYKSIKHNLIKKIDKKNVELYSQNKNINCMIENPPTMPSIYDHDYNLQNKKISETYGDLNKDTVPIVFYNHLMVGDNKKYFKNNKMKYVKTSVTHRNKKKMLTIIYYSPKQE